MPVCDICDFGVRFMLFVREYRIKLSKGLVYFEFYEYVACIVNSLKIGKIEVGPSPIFLIF